MARPPKPVFRGGIITTSSASALADLGDYGVDPPAAVARRIAAQSIPSGAATAVSFDSSVIVSASGAGMFTPTSASITIVDSGIYTVFGFTDMDAGTTGIRQLEIVQNGTAVWRDARPAPPSLTNRMSISGLVVCTVGDTLQLWIFQSQGTALNVTNARFGAIRSSG